eukprot:CAMPEP_0172659730 /NCGR_PEP_ID=MMETSP1074-20121228/3641_1 /TAXON_ID=2916 /ORGANISM="Ceratium fusus, Strain PA161109" /LENGTH=71 /DNA_ID=CAMNT_0013475263 /DNA_START=9 /DNA_END=225 /DNA_ORIENTATION=-
MTGDTDSRFVFVAKPALLCAAMWANPEAENIPIIQVCQLGPQRHQEWSNAQRTSSTQRPLPPPLQQRSVVH